MNRLLLCSLEDDSVSPHQALVRFMSGNNEYVTLGEAGEALAFSEFSRIGLGPKLYGVFAGGRLEEYVPVN